MDEQQKKQLIQDTFNTVSDGYDNKALQFFSRAASNLNESFQFIGHENVLDVATGTGIAALELASKVGEGRVTGIDFSTGMLSNASAKAQANAVTNIDFQQMDMQSMSFDAQHFDAANCSFGIFFVEDMLDLLKHIASKVRTEGKVVTTTFKESSFSPLVDIFFERIQQYGIEPPALSWKRIDTEAKATDLFQQAGLTQIKTNSYDVGYSLDHPDQWWDIIWNAGFRGLVSQLEQPDLQHFKQEHLKEIGALASSNEGFKLNVGTIQTIGFNP